MRLLFCFPFVVFCFHLFYVSAWLIASSWMRLFELVLTCFCWFCLFLVVSSVFQIVLAVVMLQFLGQSCLKLFFVVLCTFGFVTLCSGCSRWVKAQVKVLVVRSKVF